MTYPWTDIRLSQAEAAIHEADCDCAGCADALSLVAEVRRLTAERDRLIDAVKTLGSFEHFAQCPVCLADRTNGEWHANDCPAIGEG